MSELESAKLRALRAHVPTCFVCLSAYVPTCLVAYVLTCQRVLHAHVFKSQRALRAYVLTCSRAKVPCMCSCSRTITSNNKNKFSMTCFTQIFGTFSSSFSCEIKLYMKSV